MGQSTQPYKRSMAGSLGAGMKSIMGGSGRRYYVLEHKVSSKYHRAGENQKIIVDQIELGRDPKCQVRFDENFPTVSRRHAAIVRDGDNWKLVQLSKTNTTYLNGHPVDKEWYLQNGDEIQLSTNGPKMGFIVPEGEKGLVKSIGLSQRLSLFRQQALRPYKTAIAALGVVLVLCIGASAFFLTKQANMIEQYRADNLRQSEQFTQQMAAQRDKMRRDSIANAEESARQQQQHQGEINRLRGQMGAAIAAAERAAASGGGGGGAATGVAALVDQQGVAKGVYYLQTNKVVYVIDGEEHTIMNGDRPFGWGGTGFLLDDGRFVTARHCVEGWLYQNPLGDEMVSQVVRAAASNPNIKIKGYYMAISTMSGNQFEFTSDDFRIDHSKDVTAQIGTDDEGNPVSWIFAFPAAEGMDEGMWATDWASTTNTSGQRGQISADANLSRNLMPMQELIVMGFPVGLGVLDGQDRSVEPIVGELKASRRGLAGNGCILHSAGTDHGNSGGPIFALNDAGRLVVVGIVSRGDGRTEQHNWAVPMAAVR